MNIWGLKRQNSAARRHRKKLLDKKPYPSREIEKVNHAIKRRNIAINKLKEQRKKK